MTPLFYEDSLGAKISEKLHSASANADRARAERAGLPLPARGSDDLELLDDPDALDAAERAVMGVDPQAVYAEFGPDWVVVFGPSKVSGLTDNAGANASIVAMPLDAAGIRYVWDPYPPEDMPTTPAQHSVDRPFSLLVAPEDAAEARALISAYEGSALTAGMPSTHELEPEAAFTRRTLAWTLFLVFIGMDVLIAAVVVGYQLYHLIRNGHF